jgi:hypothetical protein
VRVTRWLTECDSMVITGDWVVVGAACLDCKSTSLFRVAQLVRISSASSSNFDFGGIGGEVIDDLALVGEVGSDWLCCAAIERGRR